MSKELALKSELKPEKVTRKLERVRTTYDCIFWGINTSQVTAGMAGIHLEWTGDYVRVTSDYFPGEEKWILPGGIKELSWKAE